VVFDTNVLLSGLLTRGVCEALLDACIGSGEHVIVLSEYILREFTHQATKKFALPADIVLRAVKFLGDHAEIVEPVRVAVDACRDPSDVPILGTLLAAQADCLVTGDQDLLDLKEFQGIPILSPRALHARLA
jgi:putative PIN family toxin of toxin-antitoxin system